MTYDTLTARDALLRWREEREDVEADLDHVNEDLPPLLKRAKDEEGLTVIQIADLLGFSRNTIYSYLEKEK